MEVQIPQKEWQSSPGGKVGPDLRAPGAKDPLSPSTDLRSPNPSSCGWQCVHLATPENRRL